MKVLKLLLISVLFSCAHQSNNFVKTGTYQFRGGVFENERWTDSLEFKRHSWFQELTLVFEALHVSLTSDSVFSKWLSPSELMTVNSCLDFKVALLYTWDSSRISEGQFFEEMKSYGYERISLPEFSRHLRMHPSYEKLALQRYNVYGLCQSRAISSDTSKPGLKLNFPGYRAVLF